MATVLRSGPYRFFFYSGDAAEPAHVHVERDQSWAKLWPWPVRLEESRGFGRAELNRIVQLTEDHQDQLRGAWNEFFGH